MPQGKVRTESKGPVKQNVHSIRRADAAAVIRDADSLIAVFLLGTIGGADTERPARRPWWRAPASTASFLFAKGLRRRKGSSAQRPIPHRWRASLAAAVRRVAREACAHAAAPLQRDCAPSRDTSTLLRGGMFVRWRLLVLIVVPERVRRGHSPVRRRSHRDAVKHYDDLFVLDLSQEERVDLVEYLNSL